MCVCVCACVCVYKASIGKFQNIPLPLMGVIICLLSRPLPARLSIIRGGGVTFETKNWPVYCRSVFMMLLHTNRKNCRFRNGRFPFTKPLKKGLEGNRQRIKRIRHISIGLATIYIQPVYREPQHEKYAMYGYFFGKEFKEYLHEI